MAERLLADVFARKQTDRAKPVNEEMRSIFECHCEVHDTMSVSEWEQTKSAHHERRMAIMNFVHDIMYAKTMSSADCCMAERLLADVFARQQVIFYKITRRK
ncbi:MAG: hypothetical protein J6D08_09590 [Lachnospiraceae bacterium]|nr:hypothetical protein [Lachnospiraceae bacterium]